MTKNHLEQNKIIDSLIKSDKSLGKFIKFFEKENFQIIDDYKKKSDFLSLVRIIVGQQLSISSAASIYNRFIEYYGEEINHLEKKSSEQKLKEMGFSTSKAKTVLEVSRLIKDEKLNLSITSKLSEKEAKDVLCKIKGIGPWTVENFLIFSGNNKDICPANDLGLKKGIKKIYNLDKLPSDDEVYAISEKWRPYRSIAVRYIWEIVDQDINF
tara:strand:+ start:19383 stop:20018 length:636 start_codon:yes stop_codon:yes gene_type:complete